MRSPLYFACLALAVAPAAMQAWYEPGHRMVNQLALDSLPPDFPGWVREPATAERIVFLSQEPDRWRRSREALLQHDNSLDHFTEFEQIRDAGLDLATLTPFRYAFVAAFAA